MKFQITKSVSWFNSNISEIWDVYDRILKQFGEDGVVYFWAEVIEDVKPSRYSIQWRPWYGFRDNFLIGVDGEYVWEGFEKWVRETLRRVGDCNIMLTIEAWPSKS